MSLNLNLFVPLFTAHLITDFILQSEEDVKQKNKPLVFIKHLLLTSFTAYSLVGIWSLWLLIPVIFIVHGIIDLIKLGINDSFRNHQFTLFTGDQLLHLLSLAVVSILISGSQYLSQWSDLFGKFYFDMLITVSALIIVTKAGGIAVGLFVKPFVEQLEDFENRGFLNGGKIIGYLERFLIVLFVYSGNFSGVGFLIAAKSIFRFGELFNSRNRKETEYIIIGTFFSFAFALVTGFLLRMSLQRILN